MKSIAEIEYDLICGTDPQTLAEDEGWQKINEAIDNLNDHV